MCPKDYCNAWKKWSCFLMVMKQEGRAKKLAARLHDLRSDITISQVNTPESEDVNSLGKSHEKKFLATCSLKNSFTSVETKEPSNNQASYYTLKIFPQRFYTWSEGQSEKVWNESLQAETRCLLCYLELISFSFSTERESCRHNGEALSLTSALRLCTDVLLHDAWVPLRGLKKWCRLLPLWVDL